MVGWLVSSSVHRLPFRGSALHPTSDPAYPISHCGRLLNIDATMWSRADSSAIYVGHLLFVLRGTTLALCHVQWQRSTLFMNRGGGAGAPKRQIFTAPSRQPSEEEPSAWGEGLLFPKVRCSTFTSSLCGEGKIPDSGRISFKAHPALTRSQWEQFLCI